MKRAAAVVLRSLLGAAVLLVLIEMTSRLLLPRERSEPLLARGQADWPVSWTYDRALFWRMRPHTSIAGWGSTNALGLRGPEVPPKDPAEFRILSLGESSTFGYRVHENETYSHLLEAGLGSVDGRRVRVINAGAPGYTTFQGVQYLRLRGLALAPDAVLFCFGYNDFLKISYRARRDAGPEGHSGGWTDRELFELRRTLRYRITDALLDHSNLARLAAARHELEPDAVHVDARRPRVPAADRRWALARLRELTRDHDVELAVVIPWYREFDGHAAVLRELRDWEEITLIDLPEEFASAAVGASSFFFDPAHPNPAGHRKIADAIERKLRRRWPVATGDVADNFLD